MSEDALWKRVVSMEKDWNRKAQKIRIISDYIKAKQRLIDTFGTTDIEEIRI